MDAAGSNLDSGSGKAFHEPHGNVLRDFGNYLYATQPPQSLCLFRILLGCYLLVFWFADWPYVSLSYSGEGMAFPFFGPPEGPIRGLQDLIGYVTQPVSPAAAWSLYLSTLACISLFTVGLWTRPALAAYLCLFGYHYFLQLHARETSFDRLLFIVSGLLLFSRCDAVYSLRAWLRHRKGRPRIESIPYWPARLIAIQIAFMYFGAGFFKLRAEPWLHGEVLYYTLLGSWAGPRAFWIARTFPHLGLYDLAAAATILMELYAPVFLFHPRWQKLAFGAGALFHVVIADLIHLWPFMFMPLTYVLFVQPPLVAAFCRRWESRLGVRREPEEVLYPASAQLVP